MGYGERREQRGAGELGHWRTGDIMVRDIEVVGRDREVVERDREVVGRDREVVERDREVVRRDIVVGHWGAGEMHTGSSLGVVGWRK